MNEETYTGGCLCGVVKYKLSGTDKTIHGITACHCQQCRRWSGHHWASLIGPKSGFFITSGEDNVRWYKSSPKARRGFCQTCGSALFWHGFGYPSFKNQIDVSAGSLDDAKKRTLRRHIFCADKGTYYQIKDGVPMFDKFPDR